jgi:putative peptidoglycan lipid II flippase
MRRIPRLVLASALMGAALWYAQGWLAEDLSSAARLVTKGMTLGLLSAGGAAFYFLLAFAIGGADLGMIRRNMRRRSKAAVTEQQSQD